MPKPRKQIKKASGLNRKEKIQVVKLAKSAITNVAEKKFMDSEQFTGVVPVVASSSNNTVSCVGFSSTDNESPSGSVLTYGTTPMKSQLCLRPFNVDRGNDTPGRDTANYIIGKECKPVSCHSRWRIVRLAASADALNAGNTSETGAGQPISAGPDQYPQGLAEACPVVCRMVRVVCKNVAGTETEYDPDADLFLNTRGDSVGVSSNEFDQKEMLGYKVNSRRYTTLDDKVFTIQNPLTVSWNWVPGRTSSQSQPQAGWWAPQVTNGSSNCEKHISMNHMLTQKRGGSVYFPEPITSNYTNATVGQRREFTLFHFYYKGADNLVLPASGGLRGPMDIRIDLVNTTKFIDV